MNKINTENTKLVFFSIFTILVCYGFALSNYSLSVDNEYPATPEFSLNMGRWGTNLIRYHIFNGQLPYFTLLISLIMFAVSAAQLSRIFRFTGVSSYIFCALMVTFPEIAYQFVFIMQSDGIALGFLLSTVAVQLFINSSVATFNKSSILKLSGAAFLIMFIIAIYQALILIPVIIYIVHIFQNTFQQDYTFKKELRKALYFVGLIVTAVILYFISVKIICPPVEDGYLSSYTSGATGNPFVNFGKIWYQNLIGGFYYGNKMFAIATIAGLIIALTVLIARKQIVVRLLLLLALFILPYTLSFFITNGYHPPRLYVTTGIVLAYVVTHLVATTKFEKQAVWVCSVICFANIYFVTQLYYSNYKITTHDTELAKKMDVLIQTKYPDFDPAIDYVYFYGGLPYAHHDYMRLTESEVFGGSLFSWDNGNNFRIIHFFRFQDIAHYRQVDNKEAYTKAIETAKLMPIWPNRQAIQKKDNVVVIKLGNEEGVKLY